LSFVIGRMKNLAIFSWRGLKGLRGFRGWVLIAGSLWIAGLKADASQAAFHHGGASHAIARGHGAPSAPTASRSLAANDGSRHVAGSRPGSG
jgi:hypothetical protein